MTPSRAWRPALLLALAGGAAAHPLPTPHGPNVYDVKSFGAKGDGIHDDTVAIGTAVDAILQQEKDPKYPAAKCVEHNTGPMLLYFPPGDYVVSDTIQIYPTDNTTCVTWWRTLAVIVMGDAATTTTVHLADSSGGFADAASSKPVFLTHPGYQHNDGQWLSYMDLSISIGKGNEGAVALRHVANNIGGVENITLSAPFGGAAGFDFPLFLGGLTIIKDMRVAGFTIGLNISQPQDVLVIEHLRVENATVGLQLFQKGCTVRAMTTVGVAQPITSHSDTASLIVLDSSFEHTTAQATPAISSHGGQLFVRNVTAPNFQTAIEDFTTNMSNSPSVKVPSPVVEHSHASALTFGKAAPAAATILPAVDTPTVPLSDPSTWSVFQLIGHNKTITEDLQAVIDSGAETVMLRGDPLCYTHNATGCYYAQSGTVVLRKNLRRLHGGWQSLGADGPYPAYESIRVDTCEHSEPVFIEHYTNLWRLVHNSTNALVLRYVGARGMAHFGGTVYSNVARSDIGPLFAESLMLGFRVSGDGQTGGPAMSIYAQDVYMRALDIEGYKTHAWATGSRLWVLGAKFGEVGGNPYVDAEGGTALLMGGLLNSFGCASWNRTALTGDKCTAFKFSGNADASIIGYYATEYDGSENASVAEQQGDVAASAWSSVNGSQLPARYTWWASSNQTVQCPGCQWVDGHWCWLRVGYHLPFFRSRAASPGPVPPPRPLPPSPPAPPPPGPPPIPPACKAGLAKLCPGLKCVDSFKPCPKCSPCKACLQANNDALVHGDGCPIKNGTQSPAHPWGSITYNLIKPYCCGSLPPPPPGPKPPPVGPSPPRPPPPPPANPITPSCKAALLKACPGSEDKGRTCEDCLSKHVAGLEAAGCKPAKDGSFYNIEKPWCGLG
jgi:hypothetical protein